MTIALCTACGGKKFGAFSPCDECGFIPASAEEMAKSALLSDHYYSHSELDGICDAMKAGQKIEFDPRVVAEHALVLEALESDPDAFQCKKCGDDLDSLSETLCEECKESDL